MMTSQYLARSPKERVEKEWRRISTAVVVFPVSDYFYVVHDGFCSFAEDYTREDNWVLLRNIPIIKGISI